MDIDFLNEFADYDISELITNINYLNDYDGDLSELFTSLEDSSKYSDVGSNDDRLQFKLLSYSISKDDDYIGDEN